MRAVGSQMVETEAGDDIKADLKTGTRWAWLDIGTLCIALTTVEQGRALLEAARELCAWLETRDETRKEA